MVGFGTHWRRFESIGDVLGTHWGRIGDGDVHFFFCWEALGINWGYIGEELGYFVKNIGELRELKELRKLKELR